MNERQLEKIKKIEEENKQIVEHVKNKLIKLGEDETKAQEYTELLLKLLNLNYEDGLNDGLLFMTEEKFKECGKDDE